MKKHNKTFTIFRIKGIINTDMKYISRYLGGRNLRAVGTRGSRGQLSSQILARLEAKHSSKSWIATSPTRFLHLPTALNLYTRSFYSRVHISLDEDSKETIHNA